MLIVELQRAPIRNLQWQFAMFEPPFAATINTRLCLLRLTPALNARNETDTIVCIPVN